MKLLPLINQGEYRRYKERPDINGFGQMLPGADGYDFGNGINLKTYTGNSWFLYIDDKYISLSDVGLSDADVTKAFDDVIASKLKGIL